MQQLTLFPEYSPIKKINPPIKWVGGKRWLAPQLSKMYEGHQDHIWVEPFVGAGGALLGVQPKYALVFDDNPYLINMWNWLRTCIPRQISTPTDKESYLELREKFNHLKDDKQVPYQWKGEAFYLLVQLGFNGLCRFNRKGMFNTSPGANRNGSFLNLPELDLQELSRLISPYTFSRASYQLSLSLLIHHKTPAFIYCDPPYHETFSDYFSRFSEDDHRRLFALLAELAEQGHAIAYSNSNSPLILELCNRYGFQVQLLNRPSGNRMGAGDRSQEIQEIFATKNI